MEIAAGEWWESGSWWQLAVTITASLAVGALAAWATIRANNPKREVNWWVQSNTPLMGEQFAGGNLSVHFVGVPVANPRIVELVIQNGGRRDITAGMFHNGEAIQFDFEADVCTVLDLTTSPTGSVPPRTNTAGWTVTANETSGESWLEIKPCLLRRGQLVTVTLLIDGDEKPVRCTRFPLVDVEEASVPPGLRSRALTDAFANTVLQIGPFSIGR
ncbi:hypothetical protein OG429_13625 [Streptomyces sp. NBC_00190]|uniref:hypothetical protein n=1 Tax=Streptomyces sp. NBC_00190 TaxID=2903634 RepID=UPI002E2BC5FD|nr:hypothetical protein [Streptomyces sp. NBC_00190]